MAASEGWRAGEGVSGKLGCRVVDASTMIARRGAKR